MKKSLFLIITSIFLAPVLFSQSQLSISLSDNLAYIGDRLNVKILLKTSSEIEDVKYSLKPDNFEIISESKVEKKKEKDFTIFEKIITITFFSTGNFNVGPVKADLIKTGTVYEQRESNSVPVTIKTSLTDKDKDIMPPKPPVEIRGNPLYVFKYIFLFISIALIVLIIIRFIKNRGKSEIVYSPPIPPLKEFERKIKRLFGNLPDEKKKVKKFFLSLSGVYKKFISEYYQINAEDMTTYEISKMLERIEMNDTIKEKFHKIFDLSDLSKFAKYLPQRTEYQELKKHIDKILDMLKQREEEEKREETENVPTGK